MSGLDGTPPSEGTSTPVAPATTVVAPASTSPANVPPVAGGQWFTQETLNALFADRARRAAEAREADLLKTLGFTSLDELETRLKTVETLQQELQQAQDSLVATQQSIKQQAITSKVTASLAQSSFIPEAHEDVAAMFNGTLPGGVTFDEATNELTGVDDFLKTLATQKPHWVKAPNLVPRTPLEPNSQLRPPVGSGTNQTPEIEVPVRL